MDRQIKQQTSKPSLEVVPTTLAQTAGCYLFTVSNSGLLFSQGRLASLRDVHPQTISEHLSSCDRELWPVILSFQLDIGRVKVSEFAKYLGHMSFRSKVFSGRIDTHTHTRASALPGLLKLSVAAKLLVDL